MPTPVFNFLCFVFVFRLLSASGIAAGTGWRGLKNGRDGRYWISKGMFGNLIRPSSEHTFSTRVSLGLNHSAGAV